MFLALIKAFAQLSDPRLRRVLRIGFAAALGSWIGLAATAALVLRHVRLFDNSWADTGAGAALGVVALLVPLLFFSALATFVMSFFLDDIAQGVEEKHYPALGPARAPGWRETLMGSTRFLLVMVAVTLAAAPFYLALLFVGLGVVLNYAVNGYLLGREYFDLVACRRLDAAQARLVHRNNLGRLWLCGAVINLLFQIPLLNLAAPVIATAFMVHVFQGLRPAPAPL